MADWLLKLALCAAGGLATLYFLSLIMGGL